MGPQDGRPCEDAKRRWRMAASKARARQGQSQCGSDKKPCRHMGLLHSVHTSSHFDTHGSIQPAQHAGFPGATELSFRLHATATTAANRALLVYVCRLLVFACSRVTWVNWEQLFVRKWKDVQSLCKVPIHVRQHLQTLLLPSNASLRDVKARQSGSVWKQVAMKFGATCPGAVLLSLKQLMLSLAATAPSRICCRQPTRSWR